MHLKFGYFVLHTNLLINGKKKPFPCTKLSMQNGRCEIKLCAQAPLARQGNNRIWKEIISHWMSGMKNIKYCENKHTWMGSSTRKLLSVTIQGNITAMRYRWRHLVGSSFSYPYQSQYDGTGLCIMSRG